MENSPSTNSNIAFRDLSIVEIGMYDTEGSKFYQLKNKIKFKKRTNSITGTCLSLTTLSFIYSRTKHLHFLKISRFLHPKNRRWPDDRCRNTELVAVERYHENWYTVGSFWCFLSRWFCSWTLGRALMRSAYAYVRSPWRKTSTFAYMDDV